MKTSTIKSLAAVIALAAAGLAQAQTYTLSGGFDREIPSNAVTAGSVAINQNPTDPCVATFWGIDFTTVSFTNFGASFNTPTWSSGAIADCTQFPDDMVPMGPLGGASGLDGTYRVVYNLTGAPDLTLTGGTSSSGSPNWTNAQVVVTADVVLAPSTPSFTPKSINVVATGIAGGANNQMIWDLY